MAYDVSYWQARMDQGSLVTIEYIPFHMASIVRFSGYVVYADEKTMELEIFDENGDSVERGFDIEKIETAWY